MIQIASLFGYHVGRWVLTPKAPDTRIQHPNIVHVVNETIGCFGVAGICGLAGMVISTVCRRHGRWVRVAGTFVRHGMMSIVVYMVLLDKDISRWPDRAQDALVGYTLVTTLFSA